MNSLYSQKFVNAKMCNFRFKLPINHDVKLVVQTKKFDNIQNKLSFYFNKIN